MNDPRECPTPKCGGYVALRGLCRSCYDKRWIRMTPDERKANTAAWKALRLTRRCSTCCTPLKLNRTVKGQCKKCYTRAVRQHEEAHALQAVLDRASAWKRKNDNGPGMPSTPLAARTTSNG